MVCSAWFGRAGSDRGGEGRGVHWAAGCVACNSTRLCGTASRCNIRTVLSSSGRRSAGSADAMRLENSQAPNATAATAASRARRARGDVDGRLRTARFAHLPALVVGLLSRFAWVLSLTLPHVICCPAGLGPSFSISHTAATSQAIRAAGPPWPGGRWLVGWLVVAAHAQSHSNRMQTHASK